MDANNVQPEGASAEEQTSTEETQPQLSIEEQIAKAMGEQTEITTRKIQSASDKAVARIQREADSTARMTEDALAALDATTGEGTEVAQPRRQGQGAVSQLQARRQQEVVVKQTVDTFESNIRQHITDLGLDPDDKNIDWGDSNDLSLTDRQGKILTSVGKIQKENAKLADDKRKEEFTDMEAKLRKDLGLDSVDTTTSAGGGSGSDAKFIEDFNSGALPYNKANKERAEKIME